ncbi:hypothetical protein [Streptomyces sp. AC558_RSS880]|uniref:hypothetical protein n=1 Tax=Streptomyces sp. AC558_RSS880 TaxID=2823687 RepID=UPI001C245F07|nr:hypothetical protein [Streptomyces sp. AC558_RSS880]
MRMPERLPAEVLDRSLLDSDGAPRVEREVAPAVADPVALGECSVEQDVLGVALPQDPRQPERPAGRMVDDGRDADVGGAGGYPEVGDDLRERVVPAQVGQAVKDQHRERRHPGLLTW